MEVMNITKDRITVFFSPTEVTFLCNAINESLEAVEEWEFQTRMGETRKNATEMLAQLCKLLDEAQRE